MMDRESLRTAQLPLKQHYRAEPGAALVTLTAEGTLGDGVTCAIQTGRALVEAGLHPATGGDGLSLCSGDMLLQALVACAGVTLNAVATSLGIPIERGTVHAEGDLDFRGTLGVSPEAKVGFSAIRLCFRLDSNAPAHELERLLELTERYCVVYRTLLESPPVEVSMSAVEAQSDRRWIPLGLEPTSPTTMPPTNGLRPA